MPPPIADQVIDFFQSLFKSLFSDPFSSKIAERLKRNDTIRKIEGAADAASQSLTRFFIHQQLTSEQVQHVLDGFAGLRERLKLADVANANTTPETVVEELLSESPCPQALQEGGQGATYRIALHSVIQVLMLVGPVMAEWQKLNFAATFELPQRIVNRLNEISQQMDLLGQAGQSAADDKYELLHRDYLLQRFHRIEAGTVRMTTNQDVDLRELFVMARVRPRPPKVKESGKDNDPAGLMDLASARSLFGESEKAEPSVDGNTKQAEGISALEQVRKCSRSVLIGAPGAGKSTFLEWLNLRLAGAEEPFPMAGKQAIPLLLRVRQLNPLDLPHDAALIEKATASKDRAALMPDGWLERQMQEGRVLFILDGLDEVEPELRDRNVIPWLIELCRTYPNCSYLISSRPVGYPPGALQKLSFVESDVLDFREAEIQEYVRHWCTAVRLARNEPEIEARREGNADGERIVTSFIGHPYIRHLARNPLMLSAICLVNYFEGGHLPKDRAVLYKLCVEGLLHHWDKRRGIHSDFTLRDKLRTCREVAIAMQAADRAEYRADEVEKLFSVVLGDAEQGKQLLEHIRYRTGLLLERRPNIYAFAHLTFQEYLAAEAVYEGNLLDIDAKRLASEHADGRWKEVIALYCGLSSKTAARRLIEQLIRQPDTEQLSEVLEDAYLSAGPELAKVQKTRLKVLERVAISPASGFNEGLSHFEIGEVATIANSSIGRTRTSIRLSVAYSWLDDHSDLIDEAVLLHRLHGWRKLSTFQMTELVALLHRYASDAILSRMAGDHEMYAAPGPRFSNTSEHYGTHAEVALQVLNLREKTDLYELPGLSNALLETLRVLSGRERLILNWHLGGVGSWFNKLAAARPPKDPAIWPIVIALVHKLDERLTSLPENATRSGLNDMRNGLQAWADSIERVMTAERGEIALPVVSSRRSQNPGRQKSEGKRKK